MPRNPNRLFAIIKSAATAPQIATLDTVKSPPSS